MLAPISSGRRDSGSSFTNLVNYLTKEKDPETGREVERGDVLISENLLSLETADLEMMGTAFENKRNQDAVYHFQITWRPGERPSREQWEEAAKAAIAALGYAEHQYVIAAHDDKAHFHVHVMLNKIHPESYRAHTPYRDMYILDQAMRELEHKQRWTEDVGLYRWDKADSAPARNTREQMDALSGRGQRARGKAATTERYTDVPSLQVYIQKKATLEVHALLSRDRVRWSDLHRTLAKHGLEIHKADKGGYTVGAVGTELRCKASDVFRRSFGGKANRAATETKLGQWVPASEQDRAVPGKGEQYANRSDATEKRKAQRQERDAARLKLKMRFGAYRDQHRRSQKIVTEVGAREAFAHGIKYAKERKAFGKSISEFGLIQEKIADCAVGIFAGEALCYRTVGMIDQALADVDHKDTKAIQKQIEGYAVECSIVKVWASEMLDMVVDHVVQIYAGYGYVEEYPAERAYRDARINRIFEGTNEINRLIITGWLMKSAMSGKLPLMQAIKTLMDEVMAAIADMTIQVFMMESCILRAEKIFRARLVQGQTRMLLSQWRRFMRRRLWK